jgi:hypothetical protein
MSAGKIEEYSMTKYSKSTTRTRLPVLLLAGLVAGFSGTASAADEASATQATKPERVATRAQFKAANPFHNRHVMGEKAEFARVEVATDAEDKAPRRALSKSGNPFVR